MLKQLTHTQVWVHDQDEALAFYTEKLGMEVRADVTVPEMGGFRWLTVSHRKSPISGMVTSARTSMPSFSV